MSEKEGSGGGIQVGVPEGTAKERDRQREVR